MKRWRENGLKGSIMQTEREARDGTRSEERRRQSTCEGEGEMKGMHGPEKRGRGVSEMSNGGVRHCEETMVGRDRYCEVAK